MKGAIRTDFILSAEIMAIALANLDDLGIGATAAALAVVAFAITIGVYGVVGLIVKLDDIGLHLARKSGDPAPWQYPGAYRPQAARLHFRSGDCSDAVGRRRHPRPRL